MLNKIILMGRLTRDPELRQTQSGTKVASFSLAVDRDFVVLACKRETDFIDCVAWRGTGEPAAEYFTKGQMAAEAAVERDWISVEDRLPEEHDSIFAKAYGTKRWADGMFRTISDEVLACVAFEDGHKVTMTLRTHDGAWALSSVHRGHVTHWMPLPEPPREGM